MSRDELWRGLVEAATLAQDAVEAFARDSTPQTRADADAACRDYVQRLAPVIGEVSLDKRGTDESGEVSPAVSPAESSTAEDMLFSDAPSEAMGSEPVKPMSEMSAKELDRLPRGVLEVVTQSPVAGGGAAPQRAG